MSCFKSTSASYYHLSTSCFIRVPAPHVPATYITAPNRLRCLGKIFLAASSLKVPQRRRSDRMMWIGVPEFPAGVMLQTERTRCSVVVPAIAFVGGVIIRVYRW
jgi:hypothetical protein